MRYFLLMWDCNGLETLQDISEYHPDNWDKNQLMGLMMGKKYNPAPVHRQIHLMMLRARFNPQRNYEIYIQHTDDGITAQEFAEAFNRNPQFWADYVREHHSVKLYDDRQRSERTIV